MSSFVLQALSEVTHASASRQLRIRVDSEKEDYIQAVQYELVQQTANPELQVEPAFMTADAQPYLASWVLEQDKLLAQAVVVSIHFKPGTTNTPFVKFIHSLTQPYAEIHPDSPKSPLLRSPRLLQTALTATTIMEIPFSNGAEAQEPEAKADAPRPEHVPIKSEKRSLQELKQEDHPEDEDEEELSAMDAPSTPPLSSLSLQSATSSPSSSSSLALPSSSSNSSGKRRSPTKPSVKRSPPSRKHSRSPSRQINIPPPLILGSSAGLDVLAAASSPSVPQSLYFGSAPSSASSASSSSSGLPSPYHTLHHNTPIVSSSSPFTFHALPSPSSSSSASSSQPSSAFASPSNHSSLPSSTFSSAHSSPVQSHGSLMVSSPPESVLSVQVSAFSSFEAPPVSSARHSSAVTRSSLSPSADLFLRSSAAVSASSSAASSAASSPVLPPQHPHPQLPPPLPLAPVLPTAEKKLTVDELIAQPDFPHVRLPTYIRGKERERFNKAVKDAIKKSRIREKSDDVEVSIYEGADKFGRRTRSRSSSPDTGRFLSSGGGGSSDPSGRVSPILSAMSSISLGLKPGASSSSSSSAGIIESQTGFVYDVICTTHRPSMGLHYEVPDRIEMLEKRMHRRGLIERIVPIPRREATLEQVLAVHSNNRAAYIQAASASGNVYGRDVYLSAGSWAASTHAAGGLIELVERIARDELRNGFAAIRPPGHHAGRCCPGSSSSEEEHTFLVDAGHSAATQSAPGRGIPPPSPMAVSSSSSSSPNAADAVLLSPSSARYSALMEDASSASSSDPPRPSSPSPSSSSASYDGPSSPISPRAVSSISVPSKPALPPSFGFCLINNVAIAAKHLQSSCGVQRIAIIDWDLHHGDGTQQIFYNDPGILYFSIHRYRGMAFYPGTGQAEEVGTGSGEGFNVNVPLEGVAKHSDPDYLYIFDKVLLPILREYKPEMILVSCGFDAGEHDPMNEMKVSENGYRLMTRRLMDFMGGRRIAVALEGGYHCADVAKFGTAVVETLLTPPESAEGDVDMSILGWTSDVVLPETKECTLRTMAAHRTYWKAFADIPPQPHLFLPSEKLEDAMVG